MPATKLSIYQGALRLFGDARLDIITDDTESRYAMDDAWPGVVDYCLRAAAWRFAMKTSTLAATTGPLPGFSIAYSRPADWLRTHALFILANAVERPLDIREQGIKFSSNIADAQIRYVSSDFADPSFASNPWPEHFTKAVEAYLAFQVGDRLTNSAMAGVRLSQIFGTAMTEAIAHDALPENIWLRHQLDGSLLRGMIYVLSQGYWAYALKTIEFSAAPINVPPPTTPMIGYPYSYPRPADMILSHAIFVPAGDGREHPIDFKEDAAQWSTTANYFVVRYVSGDLGLNPLGIPEPFWVTLRAYLELDGPPADPRADPRAAGPSPAAAQYAAALAAAMATDGEAENPWYRFQRNGAFLRACFHVAETGRWKFAIETLDLTADAILGQDQMVEGQLPANVYGDGSISPSYSAVFAKPADWLRTIWMYRIDPTIASSINQGGWDDWPRRQNVDFRDEKGNWHANWEHVQVRYIRRAAIDSTRWPQGYADAVLAWLEYEEARTDPKASSVAAAKLRIYEDAVDKAAQSDDTQEFPPYHTVGRLVRGRYSRSLGIGAHHLRRF